MHVSITGLGRGGTTIMGEILTHHPRVEYRFEQLGHFMHRGLDLPAICPLHAEDLDADAARRLTRWAIPNDPTKLLVEKDPRHVQRLTYLRAAFPDVRIVYMVRHPLDLACSVLGGWARQAKTYGQWLSQRLPADIEELRDLPPRIGLAAWWDRVVEADLADMLNDPLIQIVRYEDLLTNPQAVMTPLQLWLGLVPSSRVDRFLDKVSDDPSVHVSQSSAHLFLADHCRRVERWRGEWTWEEAKGAWCRCGTVAEQLGYPRP